MMWMPRQAGDARRISGRTAGAVTLETAAGADGRASARSDGVAGALAPRESVTAVPLRGEERFYHPELDVLRFVAFLLVFMLHGFAAEPAAWRAAGLGEEAARWGSSLILAGRFGVDLFFVLSSYLITELLLREWAKRGRLDVKSFYIRRALRIWPLYFVFLGAVVLLVPYVLPDEHLPNAHLLALLLFSGNWAMAVSGFPPSVAAPLWSVSIEEQFYIAWPLLIARLGPGRILPAAAIMIGIASISRLGLILADQPDRVLWTVTLSRLEPIAMGAALAVLLRGRAPRLGAPARWALFLGGIFVMVACTRYNPGGPGNLLVYPLVALGATGMLVAVLRDDAAGTLLASPVLTWLGRISYGLYVYHVLAIELVRHYADATGVLRSLPPGSVALAGFALTVALSAVSYRFIEAPFLRLKRRFTHVRSRD